MWILPRPLHTLASALDTEALTLDLQEQSQICASSLLVRSKPSPLRTWLQKWKRDSWTSHLSGRILKPSLEQPINPCGEIAGQAEPPVGGDSYGTSCGVGHAELYISCDNRTDELRLLGNGVVPQTCELAVRTLLKELLNK